MGKKFQFDTALLVTVVTALLYTWSTANFNGYILTLKLDTDIMERNFHQVIYNGLLISFQPILIYGFSLWIIAYIYSHGILPTYVHWLRAYFSRRRKVIKIRRFWFGKRNQPLIVLRAKAFFTKLSFVILISFLYLLSLSHFESIGIKKAKDLMEDYNKGKNKRSDMIDVEINKKNKTLRFLACGARTCAGIEEKTNTIFYFPSSTSYSFLYHENNVTKSSK